MIPREFTILVDDREKKPLTFPENLLIWDSSKPPHLRKLTPVRLHIRTSRLETGDYQLAGHPDRCIIERKASLDELDQNLTPSSKRSLFLDELQRLQSCSYPVLLLEGDPLELLRTRSPKTVPAVTRDQLLAVLAPYRVSLYTMSTSTPARRRAVSEWAAATLIAATRTTPP